jgi:hypothetical protein
LLEPAQLLVLVGAGTLREFLRAINDSFGGKTMKSRNFPTAIAGRKMSLLFDGTHLERLEAFDRSKVASALAQILMQGAGVRIEELDDGKR